jgi:hypothetical protein
VLQEPITTDNLLRMLDKIGLRVSSNQLWQDVKKGYLPTSEKRGLGAGLGVIGVWDQLSVRRAVYLYRLRKRGLSGSLLRMLLFLRDGWGWKQVRPICLTGIKKIVRIEQSPIKQRYRNPTVGDVKDAAFESPHKPDTALFIYGLGMYGEPFEGGSLIRLIKGIYSLSPDKDQTSDDTIDLKAKIIEHFIAGSGMTWEKVVQIVDVASEEQAAFAVIMTRAQLQFLRQSIRAAQRREGTKGVSSNLLTMLGKSAREIAEEFRTFPQRITPAQAMGSLVCVSLASLNALTEDGAEGLLFYSLLDSFFSLLNS